MKNRRIFIFPIATLLLFTIHTSIKATEYWGPEDFAKHPRMERGASDEGRLPPDLVSGGRGTIDYLQQFAMAAQFLSTLQVDDTSSVKYGGLQEGEYQWWVVQTDNTAEAIWIWSRYTSLFKDRTYAPNIEMAWNYVMNNPAYEEEGGSGDNGYYRIYNCGWAMASEMEYRRVFGDSTYLWYSDSSASYMVNNPLNLYSGPPNDILNGMVAGWAVGNLYEFGESIGDTAYQSEAVSIGSQVKDWAEGDPTARLGGWEWAMSGGAAFWGIVNSYFKRYPAGLRTWTETYDDFLQWHISSGGWQNAWNAWFAFGHYAAWNSNGTVPEKRIHKGLIDNLISLDGDGDGGIPGNETGGDFNDQSWVTSYLGFMGLDLLRIPVDVVLIPDTTAVMTGSSLGFTGVMASNVDTTTTTEGYTDVFLPDGSYFPGNPLLGPLPLTLGGGESVTQTFTQYVPPGTPAGTYTYQANIRKPYLLLLDSHHVPIDVTGGAP